MDITRISERDEDGKQFEKQEWAIADKEHFGRTIDWDSSKTYYLKAGDDDKTVGILNLKIAHGVAEIKNLLIAHDKQRQGIGGQLMTEAESIAKSHGVHKLFLTTGKNWGARRLYESLSFEVTVNKRIMTTIKTLSSIASFSIR